MLTDNPLKYEDPFRQSLNLFEKLFATYYTSLVGYAYKKVNDKQAAEDIVQDVFMGLWTKKTPSIFQNPLNPICLKQYTIVL
ncbi:MAG: hypothetical protein LUH15_14185 [Tannerellaceae bacterium]|nr:hypothetical protein [Tannerellaceae bacterium]